MLIPCSFSPGNPRGGKAKAIDENDAARYRSLAAKHNFGKVVAHAPYTLNPCSKDSKVREFAHMAMSDDLLRMGMSPAITTTFIPEAMWDRVPKKA